MPDVAFLVHLNVDDVTTLAGMAEDLQDDLANSGHDVISVEPWARPSLAQSTPTLGGIAPNLAQPPSTLGIPPNA